MERMTRDEGMTPEEYIARLEEENKKLNIIIENTEKEQKSDREHIEDLEEENKKLKFDIEARKEMKKAREEKIRFLEECLDNKERVNKSLREELEKLKSTYVYDAKQVRDIC